MSNPARGAENPRDDDFFSEISWSYLSRYFTNRVSLFRRYQDSFLQRWGQEIEGVVVEIGAEPSYSHERFFPRAERYITSNLDNSRGRVDLVLDVTDLSGVAADSQNAYVCVSVVEHVFAIERAFAELHRTLRPGGALLLTVPFGFPHHDEIDQWRPARDALIRLLQGFEIVSLTRLGGTFSTIANHLQRPKGRLTSRYLIYKSLGLGVAILGRRLDRLDGFPLGWGIYARKLQSTRVIR